MEEGDRMKIGYSKQIQERINGADDGTIFVNSDLRYDTENVWGDTQ